MMVEKRSFSELLAGAIDASSTKGCSEAAVTAIRPRTVRFKPTVKRPVVVLVSSQADLSGAGCSPSDKDFKPDRKSNVVYKPTAKLVSGTTDSLLTNMQSANLVHNQQFAEVEAMQQPNIAKHQTDLRSEIDQNLLSPAEKDGRSDQLKIFLENLEEDQRSASHTANGDRPYDDGYNWRKYGQKQVKGSEYSRSYYKCTHPNCPVKKKVERSLDGQIAEIVYKGEHNHPKPQPHKRNSTDGQCQGNVGNESNQPFWCNQQSENERHEGSAESQNEFGWSAPSSYFGRVPPSFDESVGTANFGVPPLGNSTFHSGEIEEATKGLETETDESTMRKRKRNDDLHNEAGFSAEGRQGPPQVVGQNAATDSEIVRDGFRWRKYGQKVVKGNPYPRSYYRCTSLKCNVRKYVERTSDEPSAFITTYEGKHNHEMPNKGPNSVAAKSSTKALFS